MWYNFGTEKQDKNESRSTTQGRYDRNALPGKFQVFGNASLQKLILSSDPQSDEPIIIYRQCKTDPCHYHNLGQNNKAFVILLAIPSVKLIEFRFIRQDNECMENKSDLALDDISLIYLKGDVECSNNASKLLVYLLQLSEKDYSNNIS
jgi:hypothetical protein